MIRIRRLRIVNYRGIRELDVETPNGAIARGKNGSGKTSVLNAIGAALAAADIGADAVRIGEERGEILIALDADGRALNVRRKFGPKGSTVDVTTPDGDTKARPAQVLAELLGSAPLDVVGVVLEQDKKRRRALVLQALPCKVTVEQMRQWVPGLQDGADVSGHGLEVVARFREGAYARRKAANALVAAATPKVMEAMRLADEARFVVSEGAPTMEDAERELAAAVETLATVRAKVRASEEATARSKGLREQLVALRAKAEREAMYSTQVPDLAVVEATRESLAGFVDECAKLELLLAAAREKVRELTEEFESLERATKDAERSKERAVTATAEADALEQSIAALVAPVDEQEIESAMKGERVAVDRYGRAKAKQRADELASVAAALEADAAKLEADAAKYDRIVQALTNEAPAALLASAQAPKGLELSGDDVLLDGVSLDKLCGAEQMRFAADIARALNPGVGFLVVDGLERLDPEQLDAFVAAATAGGRQLFGSLVDRGELVLAAIGVESAVAA